MATATFSVFTVALEETLTVGVGYGFGVLVEPSAIVIHQDGQIPIADDLGVGQIGISVEGLGVGGTRKYSGNWVPRQWRPVRPVARRCIPWHSWRRSWRPPSH